jgi:transposase
MMTEKRQTYTAEFTCEAVRLVTEHGDGVAEAARNLGINAHRLRRWKGPCEAQANGAFPGKGRLPPEHAELSRLREEHTRLGMEREMFKKAAAFCASESS